MEWLSGLALMLAAWFLYRSMRRRARVRYQRLAMLRQWERDNAAYVEQMRETAAAYRAMAEEAVEEYVTRTGRRLTEEDIEALADEAEAGYDVSHLVERRREEEK